MAVLSLLYHFGRIAQYLLQGNITLVLLSEVAQPSRPCHLSAATILRGELLLSSRVVDIIESFLLWASLNNGGESRVFLNGKETSIENRSHPFTEASVLCPDDFSRQLWPQGTGYKLG